MDARTAFRGSSVDPDCPLDLMRRLEWRADMLRETALQIPLGASVLDLGCGLGLLAEHLPDATRYLGVDRSAEVVALASRRFAARRGVEFRVGDLAAPDIGGLHDVVTLLHLLHQPDIDAIALLRRAIRLLRPGGSLILCAPTSPAALSAVEAEVRRFEPVEAGSTWSLEGMLTLLAHLGLTRIRSVNRQLYSGSCYLIAAGKGS